MLSINRIRNSKEKVIEGLKKRGWNDDQLLILNKIVELDDYRKKVQTQNDQLLSERNRLSKEIGQLYKDGKRDEADAAKKNVEALKEDISANEKSMSDFKQSLLELLYKVPNVPHTKVPKGLSDEDNVVIKGWTGEMPQLAEGAKAHWDLAKEYGILDFELGVKITGAGFPVFRNQGARLQRALINFFIDQALEQGYEEIVPPLLVNEASGIGTGSLPDKEGQMYAIEKDALYLIPTAEVPVTNILRCSINTRSPLCCASCASFLYLSRSCGALPRARLSMRLALLLPPWLRLLPRPRRRLLRLLFKEFHPVWRPLRV